MSIVILADRIETPIGPMLLLVKDEAMVALEFDDRPDRTRAAVKQRFPDAEWKRTPDPCGFSTRVLAYYAGDLTAIEGIPTKGGGTEFQERVWAELRHIPLGETRSYGALAEQLGDKNAMRAVGLANNRNPIAVVVPCHRVIGADGALVGYGGGLERKTWLLNHEGVPVRDGRVDPQGDLFSA
jgi:methylated-DNA-[protein]-cysteine S-methyltransferase